MSTFKNRVNDGFCRDCGKNKIANRSKSRCEECLTKNRKLNQKIIERKRHKKICVSCSVLALPNRIRCFDCLGKFAETTRLRHKIRKSSNLCTRCGQNQSAEDKGKCQPCLDSCKLLEKQRRLKRKLIVHKAYGDECACCGVSGHEFLTMDHINGDGSKYRKAGAHKGGLKLYNWIIKNNFPKDIFQLLCWSCNMAKFQSGQNICPHKLRDENVA